MNVNDKIKGFRVVRVRESEELKGTLYELVHEKTGAELAWLDNGEENMLFSITFKTLPQNDTGVFHILEHSVLEGSEKYPVKEPFLDLLKSSMNTFLNAMTSPDKTMYPVSSKNEKDFLNLTRVYLDAVFRPAIYTNESIFRQEGWHYEEEDGETFYNGVVFNEMKGELSSAGSLIEAEMMRALFPDNTYGFVSGGDPAFIPDLTYEAFLDAHRTFYSPSNARIYLDGKVPFETVLGIIEDEYLKDAAKDAAVHEIAVQQPVPAVRIEKPYEIGKEESEKDKTQITFGKVFADWSDRKKIVTYMLLASYLAGENESPLKRAILEKGLAQDVSFTVMDGTAQPFWMLRFRNTEPEKEAELRETFLETVRQAAAEGIDREELTGILNRFAFSLRELSEPQGLMRNILAMNAWLYGGDPLLYLETDDLLREMREELETDYYEKAAAELLDLDNVVTLVLVPSKTKGEEDRAKEAARVEREMAGFSDAEKEAIRETFDRMRTWQDEPDSEEAKATLPTLSLSDVAPEPEWTETQIIRAGENEIMFHPVYSNGVTYVNLFFNAADLDDEELRTASAMTELLDGLPTKRYSARELQREIRMNVGTLDYNLLLTGRRDDNRKVKAFFVVSFGVLDENLEPAIRLVTEILTATDFSYRDIIREKLVQCKESLYQSIMGAGNAYARRRAMQPYSCGGYIEEQIEGYDFIRYLNDIVENFEEKAPALEEAFARLAEKLFTAKRLTIGETATSHHAAVEIIPAGFPEGTEAPEYLERTPSMEACKEAIVIPAGVSYAALGGTTLTGGRKYDGIFRVLSSIMTYGYLWDEIRVHGGAYGCGWNAAETGVMAFYSYRDPNPVNSVEVFREAGAFIRAFADSDENTDNYIISSIAAMDGLSGTFRKGAAADIFALKGTKKEDLREIRQQMLETDKEKLRDLADLFDEVGAEGAVCIVGNEEALGDLPEDWTVYHL